MGMLITLFMFPVGWVARRRRILSVPRCSTSSSRIPANRFEHLYRGVGVMADDAMAAVYANLALHVVMVVARAALGSGVRMNAWIVAVGSELLTPFRVDTNSLAITERLNTIGCEIALQGGRRRRRGRTGRRARGAASALSI